MTSHLMRQDRGSAASCANASAVDVSTTEPGVAGVLVRTSGEIDMVTAPGWGRALDQACRSVHRAAGPPHPLDGGDGRGGHGRGGHGTGGHGTGGHGVGRDVTEAVMTLDLAGVSLLSAAGLRELATVGDLADDLDVAVRLVAPPGSVRRVLRLCGFDLRHPVLERLSTPSTV